MNTAIYNLDHLISIRVRDRKENKNYEYREAVPARRQLLFFKTKEQPAGYYYHEPFYQDTLYTVEEIRSTGLIVDEAKRKVYELPCAYLLFRDKVSFTQRDADFAKVLKWAQDIGARLNKIELEYE